MKTKTKVRASRRARRVGGRPGALIAACLCVLAWCAGPASAAPSEHFVFAAGSDVVDNGDTCTTLCQLGREGAASGQLNAPTSLSASGNQVFVAEALNQRVSVFDVAAGQFLRAFGKDVGGTDVDACTTACRAGRTSGVGFFVPGASAAAGSELFIADNQRVAVFDAASGAFKRAFGRNVGGAGINTCTGTSCLQATSGTAAGQLSGPAGVAVSGGDVFVLEATNNRVSVFNAASGGFEYMFGRNVGGAGVNFCTSSCQAGLQGGGAGQLSTPVGIALSGDASKLFVADRDNERVSVFSPGTGAFIRAFGKDVGGIGTDTCTGTCFAGTPGIGAGQFSSLAGVAVSANELLVAERGNSRVSAFDTTTGAFLRAVGQDVGGSGANVCTAICQAGSFAGPASLNVPTGVARVGDRLVVSQFFSTAPFGPNSRLAVVDALTGDPIRAFGKSVLPGGNGEAEQCRATCDAGRPGPGAGQLDTPQGVAVDGGRLFVADTNNDRMAVFDAATGAFARAFGKDVGGPGVDSCTVTCGPGTAGFARGQLDAPTAVAAADGQVFVVDSANSRVSAFNATTGAFSRGYGMGVGGVGVTTCTALCQAGSPGPGRAQFDEPAGVAVAGGELYVAERGNHRVSVFNVATGAFVRAFGKGVGGSGVDLCTAVCVTGQRGGGAGSLEEPSGIGAAGGQVFVAERVNHRVSVFTAATGAFVRASGRGVNPTGGDVCVSSCRAGQPGPGAGRIDVPIAVGVSGGQVFVTDTTDDRVSVFDATSGAFVRAFGKDVGGSGSDSCTSSCQAGSAGGGAAELNDPSGVAISGSWVYVSESSNHRLSVFSSDATAPTTTDDVPADAQTAAVTVTLNAADSGGAGLDKTYYTTGVDPPAPTTSSGVYSASARPVLGAGERIRYFSTDNAGNAEAEHASAAVVFATPPPGAPPAATEPAPAPVPSVAPPAASKPKLKLKVTAVAGWPTALRKGLLVNITGAKPGRLSLVVRKGARKVGGGTGTVARGGTANIRVTFTSSARRSLAKLKTVKLQISGGGGVVTVTLKRKASK